ncbi:metallophosphoesterase (plasmid) [Citricoccus nitrophenolicus]
MKKIILLRGCQGSGKTSLIRDYGLEQYAIGMDAFRPLFAPEVPTLDGGSTRVLGQDVQHQIFRATLAAVEHRMMLGTTIVLDAMNLTAKEQGVWSDAGRKYGYETLLIDVQGDLTNDELLARNDLRGVNKLDPLRVLECAEKGRQRYLHEAVRQITVDQIDNELTTDILDFSLYRKVVVVGDVHSCAEPLREAIAEHGGLNDRSIAWIFLGDLFDRGPDAVEVFETLVQDRDNVFLIEGNHESNLRRIVHGIAPKGKFYDALATRNQIVEAGHRPAQIIDLLSRLMAHLLFRRNGRLFIATHGGVRAADVQKAIAGDRFYGAGLPDYHFIYGASDRHKTYRKTTDYRQVDEELTDPCLDLVQFHGHRNGKHDEAPQALGTVPGVWNLESGVETGGHLSVAVIEADGTVTGHRYAGPAVAVVQAPAPARSIETDLASHPDIRAKDIGQGITAYNFTREAFSKGRWDQLSTAARGLFMRDDTVVARGYEKFFNIDEDHGFTREQVLNEFTLPVRVTEKANGFLLIAASIDGDLALYSKSGPTPFADAGRALFERLFSAEQRERFRALLERTRTSVTFEAILANDPHLVAYDEEQIVFLDVIDNAIEFRIRDELAKAVQTILGVQQAASQLATTREQLEALLALSELADHEGAVLRDARGQMTKVKAEGYRRAKRLRGALGRVLSGKADRLPGDPLMMASESRLRETGVWDRLGEYTVVNPVGQVVLDMPRIMAAIKPALVPVSV